MRQFIFIALLSIWGFAAYGPLLAAEPECMRYMPQIGKVVPVPCEEFQAPARPAQPPAPAEVSPPPPPAASREPAPEPEGVGKLKKKLVEYTEGLTSASAESGWRDSFCTWIGNGQVLHEQKDPDQVQKLQKELTALEAKLGDRRITVYRALFDKDFMNMILGTTIEPPVDTGPGTRLKQTPEGQAYVKARDALHLTCNCLREANPPKRVVCCDSCDQQTLQEGGGQTLR